MEEVFAVPPERLGTAKPKSDGESTSHPGFLTTTMAQFKAIVGAVRSTGASVIAVRSAMEKWETGCEGEVKDAIAGTIELLISGAFVVALFPADASPIGPLTIPATILGFVAVMLHFDAQVDAVMKCKASQVLELKEQMKAAEISKRLEKIEALERNFERQSRELMEMNKLQTKWKEQYNGCRRLFGDIGR